MHARGNYDVNKVGPIQPISSDEWVRFGYIVAMPGRVGFVLWAPFRALVKQFIFIPFLFWVKSTVQIDRRDEVVKREFVDGCESIV